MTFFFKNITPDYLQLIFTLNLLITKPAIKLSESYFPIRLLSPLTDIILDFLVQRLAEKPAK